MPTAAPSPRATAPAPIYIPPAKPHLGHFEMRNAFPEARKASELDLTLNVRNVAPGPPIADVPLCIVPLPILGEVE